MIINISNAVEVGCCDECGAGQRVGTQADDERGKVTITSVELGRTTVKLCDSCKNNLAAQLLGGSVMVFDEIHQALPSSQADMEHIASMQDLYSDKPYGELIVEMKGERPAWVCAFSDRTAYSLLRADFNSLQQLKLAVNEGLKIDQIPNLGRKEVDEVKQLLLTLGH